VILQEKRQESLIFLDFYFTSQPAFAEQLTAAGG
jgi:hypothetical protein